MEESTFRILAPEEIAKDYGGDKSKIANAVQMGLIDPSSGVLAGMFIDRVRSAQTQEQAPQQTVAQKVMGGGIAALPQQAAGMGGPPQGGIAAPQQMPQAPPPQAGGAGIAQLPNAGPQMASGGIVTFQKGGSTAAMEQAWLRGLRGQEPAQPQYADSPAMQNLLRTPVPPASAVDSPAMQNVMRSPVPPPVSAFPMAASQAAAPASPAASTTLPASYSGANAPKGVRNNNMGNLEDGPFTRSQPGYIGSDGRFAIFDSPEAGNRAQETLLRKNYVNGQRNLTQIVDKYLGFKPGVAGENSAASRNNYINYVASKLGIAPNAPVPKTVLTPLAQSMREFENGFTGQGNAGVARSVTKLSGANRGAQIPGSADFPEGSGDNTASRYGIAGTLGENRALVNKELAPKRDKRDALLAWFEERNSPEALEKSKKQDRWESLAELGFAMAAEGSKPGSTLLGSAAKAGKDSLPGLRAKRDAREAKQIEGLKLGTVLEDQDNQTTRELFSIAAGLTDQYIRLDEAAKQREHQRLAAEFGVSQDMVRAMFEAAVRERLQTQALDVERELTGVRADATVQAAANRGTMGGVPGIDAGTLNNLQGGRGRVTGSRLQQ